MFDFFKGPPLKLPPTLAGKKSLNETLMIIQIGDGITHIALFVSIKIMLKSESLETNLELNRLSKSGMLGKVTFTKCVLFSLFDSEIKL